jgi:hypothetical protein
VFTLAVVAHQPFPMRTFDVTNPSAFVISCDSDGGSADVTLPCASVSA